LDGGNSPRKVKGVECLLVVDIVTDVEEVPKGKVAADSEGLHECCARVIFGFGDGGSSGGRESK